MSADLLEFMRWIGLLDAPKATQKAPAGGTWYNDGEVPF